MMRRKSRKKKLANRWTETEQRSSAIPKQRS